MRYIESQFRSLYLAMLANFVIFGVTLTIIGAVLPKIIREFEWSYIATGGVISAGYIGYFVSTFLSGVLLHKLSPKQVIVGCLGLQTIGLSFFAARPMILLNLLLNFLIGLGQGGTEVVVNFSVIRIERSGQSRLMNLMHAAFSVGAVAGPFAVGILIKTGASWQTIYRLMAVVSFLMASTFLILPFSRLRREDEDSGAQPRVVDLLKHPLLILSFLILFLYVGTELGVSAWVAEYYVKVLDASESTGAFIVSVFWIGLLMGRLGLSGYGGTRQAELMSVLASTCTIALLFAVLMKSTLLAGVGFSLAGLGFSAIYPLVIAVVGRYVKRGQGAAVGFVTTGGGIGAFAFPFLMSAISDRFGIRPGFVFYIILDLIMTALCLSVIWLIRGLPQAEADDRQMPGL